MKKIKNERLSFIIIAFLSFVIGVTGLAGEITPQKNPHHVPYITSAINVDGVLEEKVWKDALVLELDNEIIPEKNMNIKAALKTEVFLLYDADHLYTAFRAFHPNPAKIRANLKQRDNIWKDDYVGITLDILNDGQRAYSFCSNTKGIQADEIIKANGYIPWDGNWKSAGKIDDKGYIVEIAIPFSILPLKGNKQEQIWGIDAVRVHFTPQTECIFNLFARDNNKCYMCQADKIVVFNSEKSGK